MKLLLDNLPLLAFFAAYFVYDLYVATAALIAGSVATVLIYRIWKGQWQRVQIAVAVVASVLGGMTLYLHDPNFIKIKPTVVYAMFAIALLGSHFIGARVLLARLPQNVVTLPDAVWRRVNLAWAAFFAVCSALNLYIAFHFSEAAWVKFKTFGFTGMMFVFLLAHAPILARYLNQDEKAKEA